MDQQKTVDRYAKILARFVLCVLRSWKIRSGGSPMSEAGSGYGLPECIETEEIVSDRILDQGGVCPCKTW